MKCKHGFFISGQGLDYLLKKYGNYITLTSQDLQSSGKWLIQRLLSFPGLQKPPFHSGVPFLLRH